MRDRIRVLAFSGIACALVACSSPAKSPYANIGRDADTATLASTSAAIMPDGAGLPAGHGSVREGRALYETRCANCHDVPAFPKLWGGIGSLRRFPQKSVTSYWPYAPTLYDYIRRAMPPRAPGSLKPDQIYALTAYILAQDGLVGPNGTLDAKTLPGVKMPNRDGFFPSDGKPDV